MKTHSLLILLALTTLVSCNNEDVGQNRKKSPNNPATPALETEGSSAAFIHRTHGTKVLTSREARERILKNTLPDAYREIPDMETDDEGSTRTRSVLSVQSLGRPTVVCGNGDNLTGLRARIANCAGKNGELATWSASNGNSGEADWKLISVNTTGKEVWMDTRTGMIWSDLQASGNYCKASGNFTGDCTEASEGESRCINLTIEGLADIKWRLPTRSDFLQADVDGLRFVLKSGTDTSFWTATMDSLSVSHQAAWTYSAVQGTLVSSPISEVKQIRCIGSSAP